MFRNVPILCFETFVSIFTFVPWSAVFTWKCPERSLGEKGVPVFPICLKETRKSYIIKFYLLLAYMETFQKANNLLKEHNPKRNSRRGCSWLWDEIAPMYFLKTLKVGNSKSRCQRASYMDLEHECHIFELCGISIYFIKFQLLRHN